MPRGAVRSLAFLAPLVLATPSLGLAQQVSDDSIRVIERGVPGFDGWDLAELPFKVVTAPLYLLALGGEWLAHSVVDARLVARAYHLSSELNRRGLYPTAASLGSGSGTGLALLVGKPSADKQAWGYVRGGVTEKQYWRVTARAGYGLEDVAPGRAGVFGSQLYGWIEERPEDEYYGIGNDSEEGNLSDYRLRRVTAGGKLGFAATSDIAITLGANWSRIETGPGQNTALPNLDSIFGASEAPRFGARDRYLSLAAASEWRSGRGGLQPGGRSLRLGLQWNQGYSSGAADFLEFEAAARASFPFDHEIRSVTLAVLYQAVRPQGDGEIPFYRLPTLGGSSTLPAYRTGRLRGREMILGEAEYAYRIWLNPTLTSAVVASIFLHGGMVAEDMAEEFALRELWPAYGIALASRTATGSGARLELAGGDEGLRVNFTFLLGY